MRKGIDQGLAVQRAPEFLIQDGMWKLRSGNPAIARASLEEALKLDPSNMRALAALNSTYVAQKQGQAAIARVKELAAAQPKSAPVQEFLGTLLMANGERKEARAAFELAKADDPRAVAADLALTQMDFAERKFDDARARLQTVLSMDAGNLTVLRWLGVIEEARSDYPTAITYLRKVVASDPDDTQASNNLAYLLTEHTDDLDEALTYAQRAVERDPGRLDYSDTLGWILYRKGLYPAAIKYLEKASSDPRNAVWRYHLAMAYAKAGDRPRSLTTLEAALLLNPNVPEAKAARELVGLSK
jgi:Tfp pilus assembly protein PilF